jgi:hypothetical protein
MIKAIYGEPSPSYRTTTPTTPLSLPSAEANEDTLIERMFLSGYTIQARYFDFVKWLPLKLLWYVYFTHRSLNWCLSLQLSTMHTVLFTAEPPTRRKDKDVLFST